MTIQELKDEMAQDMLEEAKRDADYEHRMRTDWEFALEQINGRSLRLEEAAETLKYAIKQLEEYDWIIGVNEIIDSY